MLISSESCRILGDKLRSGCDRVYCRGLFLSAKWFVLSQTAGNGLHLVVLPDKETAEYCTSDLYNLIEGDKVFFLPESGKNVERSNYKSSLAVQRTAAIGAVMSWKKDELTLVVSYPEALDERVPSARSIKDSVLKIKAGQEISHDSIVEILSRNGFEKVDFVSAPGQYAIRGSIVDIFSYSWNYPYRISFWGNEVEKINIFDCNTQLSVSEEKEMEVISDIMSSGESSEASIFDLLPESAMLWLDSSDMYRERDFFSLAEKFRAVFIDTPLSVSTDDEIKFGISPQPSFNKNFELLTEDIRNRLENGYKVLIYGDKTSQLDRIKSILSQNGGLIPEFVAGKTIHQGFVDSENKVCCYSDHEIFDRFQRVSIRRSVEKSEQLTINDLNSFNIGDYVVHIDHGVGIFGGLVRMRDDKGRVHEVVKITYKDGDVVFVSVHALNKISRFRSKDGEPPRINKLGSKTWSTLKSNAKSKVKDIAKELILLYAKRRASKGFAFSADTYLQEELESSFMYEDTPDQESATIAVKRDMEDDCPMDRLVCGDVGFGKTEIAIRAAFKAVADSKQVAVLVPTTILALQHYNTFRMRLQNLPCNIDYVSRLRTAKEVSQIKERLKNGEIDVLIGTHKILGKDFGFKDLGLLIIDEEQKFGVSAKEKLRALKASVDTLTLTATPIPRTLQFSLLGARDLSIINTPPPNRIPVQTEIILFDEKEIKGIINYELNRGGQLFFLHNRVEELNSIYEILHRLVPDMKICIAHGQMESRHLENIMLDFMRGDYDMMLCTTLIENGLDIPNANTIIINQAQNFGLSDLHQLRGRVGRSNKKAFCYLIVPPLASITDEARRRLKAIEEFSDLGSGFNIAMQDLDIRGAGNLLGAEQSGFITEMGFETYQKILSEAMEELGVETGTVPRSDRGRYVTDCTVETDQPALIPDDYIDITAEKIRIYRAIDSMNSDKETDNYAKRLADRFGKLPEELDNLFYVVKIRNAGARLGFEKIIIKNGLLIAFFVSNPMSPYYKSDTFASVMEKIASCQGSIELKQNENKLKILSRNVVSLKQAYGILSRLR
ncbi:MAG: transcription-repair coupling factor [Bacteroidetes bacterium]|uniref:Transcription-repair-coupling factor n=1 Tax=Candidatus Cryptobacteroides avistercoris TaxID=2840758 RepID=A0A9D9NNU5_9BACT|nr:transcription-repair coupling factor [Candidatus Cryptobacteroides avistercoris]